MLHRRIPLLLLVILLPLVLLAILMALAGSIMAMPKCAATHDDGTTVFATVQEAANAAGPGATVKVAGLCAGVDTFDSLFQTLYITKSLTLRGGYTGTNWFVSDPVANPTTLDARVSAG
jgi:threonine dehydrogenase-like Zn-dependent dehydrogenase